MGVIISFLSTPAYLIGLIVLVGLILQKKNVGDIIKGTMKAIMGFMIISAGTAYLETNALNQFGEIFKYAFNLQGVLSSNEAVIGLALTTKAVDTAYIMIISMILNVVLVKFSRLKYIFLTGNHVFLMSMVLAVVLSASGLSSWPLRLCGGFLTALLSGICPALCMPTMKKVTGSDEIALGHFGGFGYALAGEVGKLFKGKSKSTEEINFPKSLYFFRDNMVSIGLMMVVIFLIITGVAMGRGLMNEDPSMYPYLSGLFAEGITASSWVQWAVSCGLAFSASISISLYGIQLLLNELVPAFKGLTDKFVPDAIPAVDCPVSYSFAPNAVLIGFISSFIGGVVGLVILTLLSRTFPVPLILPGVVAHFYCGATAGVFGNSQGGIKGCIAGAFVHGLLITFLGAMITPFMTSIGFLNTTFSDSDFSLITMFLSMIYKVFHGTPVLILSIVLFCVPIIYNYIAPKKEMKTEEN